MAAAILSDEKKGYGNRKSGNTQLENLANHTNQDSFAKATSISKMKTNNNVLAKFKLAKDNKRLSVLFGIVQDCERKRFVRDRCDERIGSPYYRLFNVG